MATESGVYNTTSAVHGACYSKSHVSLKMLNLRPALYILMQEAVRLIRAVQSETFGRTVNNKCLVSENVLFLRTG
jgi:hypothetical protein